MKNINVLLLLIFIFIMMCSCQSKDNNVQTDLDNENIINKNIEKLSSINLMSDTISDTDESKYSFSSYMMIINPAITYQNNDTKTDTSEDNNSNINLSYRFSLLLNTNGLNPKEIIIKSIKTTTKPKYGNIKYYAIDTAKGEQDYTLKMRENEISEDYVYGNYGIVDNSRINISFSITLENILTVKKEDLFKNNYKQILLSNNIDNSNLYFESTVVICIHDDEYYCLPIIINNKDVDYSKDIYGIYNLDKLIYFQKI